MLTWDRLNILKKQIELPRRHAAVRLFCAALRVLVLVLFEVFGYTSATSARADRHVPRVLRIRSGRSRHSMLSSY